MILSTDALTLPQRSTKIPRKKKPGSREPGLRYWPSEADTITFQEGLLSFRVTGGGGQMRNANAQCPWTMSRADGLRQAPAPHVSHAEMMGRDVRIRTWPQRVCHIEPAKHHEGQRCALLTTKSRN